MRDEAFQIFTIAGLTLASLRNWVDGSVCFAHFRISLTTVPGMEMYNRSQSLFYFFRSPNLTFLVRSYHLSLHQATSRGRPIEGLGPFELGLGNAQMV